MNYPKPNSLAFRVSLFFAANPDEELNTDDVVVKFGVQIGSVYSSLSPYVHSGVLERTLNGPGRGKMAVYRAGMELLQAVGATSLRPVAAACATACMAESTSVTSES